MFKPFPNSLQLSPAQVFEHIAATAPAKLQDYQRYATAVDDKGCYEYFDKFRFHVPATLNAELAWLVKKLARSVQHQPLLALLKGQTSQAASYLLTPTAQKALSLTDRFTTTVALDAMLSELGEEPQRLYLLNDLLQEEGISSSQLEGAATTTVVAKEMLSKQRAPRTLDERMILGNYRMMRLAWEARSRELSLALIRELHVEGTRDIDDARYAPGELRHANDVVVTDIDNNVVYQPPTFEGLDARLQTLCDWANTTHDDVERPNYLHPVIKAIVLHFCIGYEHPFRDGNGRVARALFYWFLFRCGYSAFQYISISVLLKNAPSQYAHVYLYAEHDELDLTYFIDHQCGVLLKAVQQFRDAYDQARQRQEAFNTQLYHSRIYQQLNANQRIVLQVAMQGIETEFTATSVKRNLGCAYNTAASVLNGLVDLALFTKYKRGKEWHYRILSKDALQKRLL